MLVLSTSIFYTDFRISKNDVVNPGPLLYGQFMYMELERPKMEGKWVVKRKVYEQLDY